VVLSRPTELARSPGGRGPARAADSRQLRQSAGPGTWAVGSPRRAAPASPWPPPGRQPESATPGLTATAVGGPVMAGVLGLGLGAVVRQRLRQRHRRQRAWWGSQPRPRSSTRNGIAAPPAARPPCASATRRPAAVACRLMRHHHRSGPDRPGRGDGAGGSDRSPAAARRRRGPGGAAGGLLGRRPVGRTGSRTTAGRCGDGRTHRPDGAGHSGGNL
jgi:hypothetical protein